MLGTILIIAEHSRTSRARSAPSASRRSAPTQVADALSQSGGGAAAGGSATRPARPPQRAFEAVQHDFADATQTVFYVMAGIMVVTYVVAHFWLPKDRILQDVAADVTGPSSPEA